MIVPPPPPPQWMQPDPSAEHHRHRDQLWRDVALAYCGKGDPRVGRSLLRGEPEPQLKPFPVEMADLVLKAYDERFSSPTL